MDNKKVISVDSFVDDTGRNIPTCIHWTNGKHYNIRRILHTCISSNNEFEGICYTVQIGNKQKNIYCDKGIWYIMMSG